MPLIFAKVNARRSLAALTAVCVCFSDVSIAYADSPAVTDFGQITVERAWTGDGKGGQAAFLTYHSDGQATVEIVRVRDDSIVSFATDRPAWRIDPGLTWFVQMPVYVRDLSGAPREALGDGV